MARTDCVERVLKHIGTDKISKSELLNIVEELEEIKLNNPETFEQAFDEQLLSVKQSLDMDTLQAVQSDLNAVKHLSFVKSGVFKGDDAEGLHAFVGGTSVAGKDTRSGTIPSFINKKRSSYQREFYGSLERIEVDGVKVGREGFETYSSGRIDDDIAAEKHMGRQGILTESVTGNKLAFEIAKLELALDKRIIKDLQDAGVRIEFLDGHIVSQSTHPDILKKLGKTEWLKLITRSSLDLKKSIPESVRGNKKETIKYLGNMYDEMVDGRHEVMTSWPG